jgi:WD40 repeat protein
MLKSKDTRTILWDLATGRDRMSLEGQVAGDFSPDGKRIVTFSKRAGESSRFDAAVWDTFTGRQLVKAKLDEYSNPHGDTLHFSPDGRRFVHVDNGAFLLYNPSGGILYNASDGREIGRAAARYGAHRYTSTGALASFDSERATLTDLESGRVVQSIPHDLGTVDAVWTHDGGRVATVGWGEDVIKFWDLKSGKVTAQARGGPQRKRTAIISPDNSRLAVEWGGANDIEPGLGIYDMNAGKEIARIKLPELGHIVGFSPDSKTLLVGGSEFVIYNSEDGKQIRALKLLDDVNFSHD